MPIPKYSVLKGHPIAGVVRGGGGGKPPHFHFTVDAGVAGDSFDIAVNIQSQDLSQVKYVVKKQFQPPHEQELVSLKPGMHSLTGTQNPLAPLRLDYAKDNLVVLAEMSDLPLPSSPGNENLHNELGDLFSRAVDDPDSTLYAFGAAYPNNSGIHDIHMNQGNPKKVPQGQKSHFRDNGREQDGGLFIFLPAANGAQGTWIGVFIAFRTQRWDNDPVTGHPLSPAASPPALPQLLSNLSRMDNMLDTVTVTEDQNEAEMRQRFGLVLAALGLHGEEIAALPGVVAVRPDFYYQRDTVTDQPIVSVVLEQKAIAVTPSMTAGIPARLGRVAIQVIEATETEKTLYTSQSEPRTGVVGFSLPGESGHGDEVSSLETPVSQQEITA